MAAGERDEEEGERVTGESVGARGEGEGRGACRRPARRD